MDLSILVADRNMEFAVRGLLGRPESLGTAHISYDIRVHAGHDGGVRTTGPDILALSRGASAHLLMLDFEGSGTDVATAIDLERHLNLQLQFKIGERSRAIVIEPECDAWVWGSDNRLAEILGWENPTTIRNFLLERGFELNQAGKPTRPKEAIETALRAANIPRSSSLYLQITSRISLARCTDLAFARFKDTLQEWFPVDAANRP